MYLHHDSQVYRKIRLPMTLLIYVYQSHEDAMMVQHLASETTYLNS